VDVGITLGPSASIADTLRLAAECEASGVPSLWLSEANGYEPLAVATLVLARTRSLHVGTAAVQMFTRSPTALGMAAATIAAIGQGRFTLGIGVSTRHILRQWHGIEVGRPLDGVRQYFEVLRHVLGPSCEPASFADGQFHVGQSGDDQFRLRVPEPVPPVAVLLAALGPQLTAMAHEVADGSIRLFHSPDRVSSDATTQLATHGLPANDYNRHRRVAIVPTILGDDLQSCRDLVKPWLANYIAPPEPNPYATLVRSYGFGETVDDVRVLRAQGRKLQAYQRVPNDLVDKVCLLGPADRVRARLEDWRQSGIDTLVAGTVQPEVVQLLGRSFREWTS
jgi:alkanesulfonate monooxygenase SsuD/methylene tetrahydromethanopterin reductase-like flavin-dependent oxidoreductase (luciferase family)